ncbi:hypothetical protein E3N88_09622 [Mikania micrantha]|uniref:Retrotransposon Copia-like N-terminal domain-containing protein n=1 Tax=Mikania micrantha TaxID=192012 RepID=A0A5N6PLT9_9ASTR|nr:hypothetical protein E3N88_09622 [Mikania micrantha]
MVGGSSSSCSSVEAYPYPSHVCATNFVTVKLIGQDTYDVWRTQMLCMLESHDMLGFIRLSALGMEQIVVSQYDVSQNTSVENVNTVDEKHHAPSDETTSDVNIVPEVQCGFS